MISGIITRLFHLLEDLGNLLFYLLRYCINQQVMFLICSAFSVCSTSKLNLQLICHANGGKVYTLGFVLCSAGDAHD